MTEQKMNRSSDSKKMRVLDMHAHLSCQEDEKKNQLSKIEQYKLAIQEIRLREKLGIATFFSCGTPEEWRFWEKLGYKSEELWKREQKSWANCGILLSFGIHPWYADQYDPIQCRREPETDPFALCGAVGEIGMDSVWCTIPLKQQRDCFVKQLEIAAEQKKPVILHTKGQEAEIVQLVQDFPGKICVHWYSGDEKTFERFLELDCYFTLGPDAAQRGEKKDRLRRRMLLEIPEDRLFFETDGVGAVSWALGKLTADASLEAELYRASEILEQNCRLAAVERKMQAESLQERVWKNLEEFLK